MSRNYFPHLASASFPAKNEHYEEPFFHLVERSKIKDLTGTAQLVLGGQAARLDHGHGDSIGFGKVAQGEHHIAHVFLRDSY